MLGGGLFVGVRPMLDCEKVYENRSEDKMLVVKGKELKIHRTISRPHKTAIHPIINLGNITCAGRKATVSIQSDQSKRENLTCEHHLMSGKGGDQPCKGKSKAKARTKGSRDQVGVTLRWPCAQIKYPVNVGSKVGGPGRKVGLRKTR